MQATNNNETLISREPFFVPADLKVDDKNCGDDRGNLGIHMFGGVLFIAINRAVMRETAAPGSVTELGSWIESSTIALSTQAIENLGIHSDETSENGLAYRSDSQEPVGCAYAKSRAAISRLIGGNASSLVDQAEALFPDIIAGEAERHYALNVAAAHGRLADREGVFINGRTLQGYALQTGAQSTVYSGSHDPYASGIINTQHSSKFDSTAARDNGLPTYVQDLWASDEFLQLLDAVEPKHVTIASIVDTLGTFRALGVEQVARR